MVSPELTAGRCFSRVCARAYSADSPRDQLKHVQDLSAGILSRSYRPWQSQSSAAFDVVASSDGVGCFLREARCRGSRAVGEASGCGDAA
eukprot:2314960-Rhodomonas_salina.2